MMKILNYYIIILDMQIILIRKEDIPINEDIITKMKNIYFRGNNEINEN